MKKSKNLCKGLKDKAKKRAKVMVQVNVGVYVFVLPMIIGAGITLYRKKKCSEKSKETDHHCQ